MPSDAEVEADFFNALTLRVRACLENVVHRSGEGPASKLNVLRIEVPDTLAVEELTLPDLPDLPPGWQLTSVYVRYRLLPSVAARWWPYCGRLHPSSPTSTAMCLTPSISILRRWASWDGKTLPSTRVSRPRSRARNREGY